MSKGRWKDLREPSRAEWLDIASEEAEKVGLTRRHLLLSKCRERVVVLARARAWRRLKGGNKYSICAVGRTTGFDHTSVRSGLMSLPRLEAWYAGRPVKPAPPVKVDAPPPLPKLLKTTAAADWEIIVRDAWRASLGLTQPGQRYRLPGDAL